MNWREPVLDYCERLDGGFWSEPANAVSNAAFLVAAAAAYLLLRRRGGRDLPATALIFIVASVGAGSFVFHTVATRGAMQLDVLPIAVFINGYLLLALRRFLGLGLGASVAITLLFGLASHFVEARYAGWNGSIAYLPALAALIILAALLWIGSGRRDRPAAQGLALAAAIFAVSLTFRTVDRAVCAAVPLGTHFLWHLLNACALWLLLRTAIFAGGGARLTSGDAEPESQGADGGVRSGDRPDVFRNLIGRGPDEPDEESVREQ
jgi:hypothetical protein